MHFKYEFDSFPVKCFHVQSGPMCTFLALHFAFQYFQQVSAVWQHYYHYYLFVTLKIVYPYVIVLHFMNT